MAEESPTEIDGDFQNGKTLLNLARAKWHKRRFLAHILDIPAGNWVNLGEAAFLLLVLILNFWLLSPFFGAKDVYNSFSAPLVPLLANLTAFLFPYPYGIRLWLLLFLVILPFTFYLFIRDVSGRRLAGFTATLIVSLPLGFFLPSRVELALFSGDGSAVASLAIIPLICLFLRRFLRRGFFWAGVIGAGGFALVALTSPLGFFVLLIFALVLVFSEMLLGQARLKLLRFLIVLILAGGLSVFWYSPQFLVLVLQSPGGQMISKAVANLIPVSFFTVPVLGVIGFLLFENRPLLQPVFLAFFLTVAFGLLSLSANVSLTLPSRFLPALGVSLALLGGVVLTRLYDWSRGQSHHLWRKGRKFTPLFLGALFLGLTLLAVYQGSLSSLEEERVLGATAGPIVGLWGIRDEVGRLSSLIGSAITGVTIIAIGFSGLKIGGRGQR